MSVTKQSMIEAYVNDEIDVEDLINKVIGLQKLSKKQAERIEELERGLESSKEHNKRIKKEARHNDYQKLQRRFYKVSKQNKHYREIINAVRGIIKDAIYSLDNEKKVQGLEFAVKIADEALEGEDG